MNLIRNSPPPLRSRPVAGGGPSAAGWLWLAGLLAIGCDRADVSDAPPPELALPSVAALGESPGGVVVAQGTLEPAGGVLPVMAPVGDRVVSVGVAAGDSVETGQTLAELQSLAARRSELALARTQLSEAEAKATSERAVASARLDVAKVALRQAELQLQHARERFRQAESDGGQLDLLRQAATLAEKQLQQLRRAAEDPSAGRLVSTTRLEEQQLEVSQARAEWQAAQQAAVQEIEQGELAVEAAKREIAAAELAIEAGQVASSLESLRQRVELLELQVAAVELTSPMDAAVLSVEIQPGEAVTAQPLMHLADTGDMVCVAEVDVADLPRVSIGATAKMSSPALPQPLTGEVRAISRLVGAPKLPTPYPMAAADWRSVEVTIGVAEEDRELAAAWIHLPVDVAIAARSDAPPASP